MLLAVSQSCYTNGGKPTLLDVGAFNKRTVSGFPGNVTRHVTASEQTLINSIDVYEDDFNKLKVVPNRFALARNAVLWDLDNAKVAYLRASTRGTCHHGLEPAQADRGEWALEVCNPAAHGIVRDLTTS
jgi:hypothetical protein